MAFIPGGTRGLVGTQVDPGTHVVLIPAILVLAAILSHRSGLDHAVASWFFDEGTRTFPARQSAMLELVGHKWANGAVVCLFLSLVICAALASWSLPLRRHRRLLCMTAVAMAAGPTLVVALKSVTAAKCPWALVQYGGSALAPDVWFAAPVNAGECFPGGHAAGGFALISLFFAGQASGNRALERGGLLVAVVAGTAFSVVRMSQGAHRIGEVVVGQRSIHRQIPIEEARREGKDRLRSPRLK